MSAKQARMSRRIMSNYKELEPKPYLHLQGNPNPKFIENLPEDVSEEEKEQVKLYNEEQKTLKFDSRIVPQRRLRRMAKALRIPLQVLVLYVFKTKDALSVAGNTSVSKTDIQGSNP